MFLNLEVKHKMRNANIKITMTIKSRTSKISEKISKCVAYAKLECQKEKRMLK